MKLKRIKVTNEHSQPGQGPGAYDIVDENGTVVARVEEWGVRGYRWRVVPTDRSIRSWDTTSIALAIHDLPAVLAKAAQS